MKYSLALFIVIFALVLHEKSSNAKCLNSIYKSETPINIDSTTVKPVNVHPTSTFLFTPPHTSQPLSSRPRTSQPRTSRTKKMVITHYFHPW